MAHGKPGPAPQPPIRPESLTGFKYHKLLAPFLKRLRTVGTDPKRKFFYDQYLTLLLFYFFNPTLKSLRGIRQVTEFEPVQRKLGVRRTSLGSLSEAQSVFDADLLVEIIQELSGRAGPLPLDPRLKSVDAILTAVDGTLLKALPKMVWALWLDKEHRAVKAHIHFEVLKGIPVRADVTEGSGSERAALRRGLEPGRLYILDRGYLEYGLFQQIQEAGSSFVARIDQDAVIHTTEERSLSQEARAAGVLRDRGVRLGGPATCGDLQKPVRLVEVPTRTKGKETLLRLVSDRMDLPAEVMALIYQHRWQVELFFRWLKCILGCRHLLALSPNGVTIQIYAAIIASLLISVWTGLKPTRRTYEAICLYFQGWVHEKELLDHIQKRLSKETALQKTR